MNIFKLLKSVQHLKSVTAGRHTEAPGKPQPTGTKPVPDKKHIRADTQTHMDLKLEKAVDRSRWQSGVDAKDFGQVSESQANPGTHMIQATGGQLGARKAGDGSPKTWYYFHFNKETGKYGSSGNPDTESKLHRDIFEKVVAPQLANHPRHAKGHPIAYDGITNPNMAIAHGKPNPHFPDNPYLKGKPQGNAEVVDLKSRAKIAKSGSWHVKIKGLDGYHPLKDIKDLGPEKGNNYVLHDGRQFHQSKIEDMRPAPKPLTKAEGDWKKEGGYTFNTIPGKKVHEVEAHKDGKPVANAILHDKGKHLEVTNINVDPAHQRKGIASHIQKLAEETFKKRVKPSKIQTPEGKAFFRRRLTKSEIEVLEKAAPGYRGEVDPEKDNIAVENPIDRNRLVWQHGPKKAASFQSTIDQHLDKFVSQFGEHGPVLKDAINRGLANKKHVDLVPTALKYDEIHTPRRRHFAFLVSGHPSTKIKHLGNGEFLWYQDRHGEGGRLPETWWKVNKQGIQDVTKHHIGKAKEIFGKSDETSGARGPEYANKDQVRNIRSYRKRVYPRGALSSGSNVVRNVNTATSGNYGNVRPERPSQGPNGARPDLRAATGSGSKLAKDAIPGGRADFKKPSDFAPSQLKQGQTHEKEHTRDPKIAREIAMDHLAEDKQYYTKLKAVEAPKKLAKSSDTQIASIAVLDGDHLLMGKRNDNQRWTLPGGHLNAGEDPLSGAKRELLEETGISVPLEAFHYLGSEDVVTFTGKKIIVHSFVAYGRYDTNTELDPDQEVQHWIYVDVTNGLPQAVHDNLHSPKNSTLAKIGISH